MLINDKRLNYTPIEGTPVGSVVQYEDSYYIVTDYKFTCNSYFNDYVSVVNLKTGEHYWIDKSKDVVLCDAELLIS